MKSVRRRKSAGGGVLALGSSLKNDDLTFVGERGPFAENESLVSRRRPLGLPEPIELPPNGPVSDAFRPPAVELLPSFALPCCSFRGELTEDENN